MLRMETVQKDVLDHVEQTLRTEFMTNLARGPRRDAHEIMAEIFNNFDRTTEARFMTALEERSCDAAERIKELMFTFEDLHPHRRRRHSGAAAPGRQGPAGGRAEGRRRAAQGAVPRPTCRERAANMLREDMESLGPVRLRDVDEAQGGDRRRGQGAWPTPATSYSAVPTAPTS